MENPHEALKRILRIPFPLRHLYDLKVSSLCPTFKYQAEMEGLREIGLTVEAFLWRFRPKLPSIHSCLAKADSLFVNFPSSY